MKRWIIIQVLTDHLGVTWTQRCQCRAWITASPGGETQDQSVFTAAASPSVAGRTETPGRSSSCLLATHDQMTLACGLKHSVGGVQSQGITTEPVLFLCFVYSPVFNPARQIQDSFLFATAAMTCRCSQTFYLLLVLFIKLTEKNDFNLLIKMCFLPFLFLLLSGIQRKIRKKWVNTTLILILTLFILKLLLKKCITSRNEKKWAKHKIPKSKNYTELIYLRKQSDTQSRLK